MELEMSFSGQCNYCQMKDFQRRLKKGYRITILKARMPGMGGLDVYVAPRDVEIDAENLDHRDQYWVCWFWSLGRRCEC